MSKNLRGLSERKGLQRSLIEEIAEVGGTSGSDREDILSDISSRSLTSKSAVLGVSSFYDFLRKEHSGKKVFICDGTACLTSGKLEKLKKELLSVFDEDEIGTVTCLGHCHSNNAILYNHATYFSGSSG